jgi:hypothetical protein
VDAELVVSVLQMLANGAVGVEPETDHVFHADGASNIVVAAEPVELALREVVRVLPRPLDRRQRVLREMGLVGVADGGGHLPSRLTREDEGRVAERTPLVVGDDITRDEPS